MQILINHPLILKSQKKNNIDKTPKVVYNNIRSKESGRRWEDTGLLEGWPGMGKKFDKEL